MCVLVFMCMCMCECLCVVCMCVCVCRLPYIPLHCVLSEVYCLTITLHSITLCVEGCIVSQSEDIFCLCLCWCLCVCMRMYLCLWFVCVYALPYIPLHCVLRGVLSHNQKTITQPAYIPLSSAPGQEKTGRSYRFKASESTVNV